MKYSILLMSLIAFTGVLTGCGPSVTEKPTSGAYQLTATEMSNVNSASVKFFQSKVIEANGKVYTGESLGCMGSDSDRDVNVTCTGNQPAMQGGAIYMAEREILCNYGGAAAGCKKK
jgi:hypothetical protein